MRTYFTSVSLALLAVSAKKPLATAKPRNPVLTVAMRQQLLRETLPGGCCAHVLQGAKVVKRK